MTETAATVPVLSDVWAALGDSAGDRAVALFRRLHASGMTVPELQRALSMMITSSNLHAGAEGEALAVAKLQSWLETVDPIPAASVAHSVDRERLAKGVGTVLERLDPADLEVSTVTVTAGLHRLARAEAVAAGQGAYRDTMSRSPKVTGWRRQTEADACELCRWWSRDGQVWPKDHPLQTHTGCTCAQHFVTVDADTMPIPKPAPAPREGTFQEPRKPGETQEQATERRRKYEALLKRLDEEANE